MSSSTSNQVVPLVFKDEVLDMFNLLNGSTTDIECYREHFDVLAGMAVDTEACLKSFKMKLSSA
jgi:hypothetical protein